jgi:hypothetical protein
VRSTSERKILVTLASDEAAFITAAVLDVDGGAVAKL